MASIKNLKKDINYTLGDLIDECYVWQLLFPKKDQIASEAIIDDAILAFDALIAKLNLKKVENKKAHFKVVGEELEVKATELAGRINKL
jgi:hypothetical protein